MISNSKMYHFHHLIRLSGSHDCNLLERQFGYVAGQATLLVLQVRPNLQAPHDTASKLQEVLTKHCLTSGKLSAGRQQQGAKLNFLLDYIGDADADIYVGSTRL